MLKIKFISFIAILALLLSCTEEDNKLPKNWHIQGKVEKGPFVRGSNVTIQELDESLNPTGRSFKTSINDHEGNFSLDNITLQTPYVLLVAEGYYFNEVKGNLSEGQISLQSLADLTVGSSINVNILTHLKKDRLTRLIKEEHLSYKEANIQAQKELLSCFGLHRYADKEVNTYSITSGTDESGALIVVSSTLLKDMSEAKFTERLAGLSEELKSNGKFSDTNRNLMWKNSTELNVDNISKHIVERYKSLGKDVVVPDLAYFVDWDKNGIAGDELGSGTNKELSFEKDSLFIGKEGGKFKIKINGSTPCRFTTIPPLIESLFYDMGIREVKYKGTITNDRYLELNIEPAEAILMKATAVTVYSYDERISATLQIIQESNPNGELISKDVTALYGGVLEGMRNTFSMSALMEAYYSQSIIPKEGSKWDSFYKHDLFPYNSEINEAWKYAYRPLRNIRMMTEAYENKNLDLGVAAFKNIEAMIYYQLGVLWGNIAYVKDNNEMFNFPQLNEKQILAVFEEPLLKSIELMQGKKNNNLIFVSKDAPRAILAKMYMQAGEYTKAMVLLKAIISNGDYEISSSWENLFAKNNKELIFSLLQDIKVNDYSSLIVKSHYLPLLTYTEVVLSAAECELRVGNRNGALSYLNMVRNKRGKLNVDSNNLETALEATWKEELKGCFSYFAFLKRNNLAENKLKIESYQKLFPIPGQEIMLSPSIKQNPGY